MSSSERAEALIAEIRGERHRRALGRALTLAESERPEDRRLAHAVIEKLPPPNQTFRLGVSGPPGVGKSTFIEAYGREVIARGHRLAVLAIDPTSGRSGGSILGDKTRMDLLSREDKAFVRPSPSSGRLGGTGPATPTAIRLCEAAGYDYIIVETVGVGQAEWIVHEMTDAFLLLAQPAAGDELQTIKRGILELADHVAVTKADALPEAAARTAAELRRGLHLAPSRPDGWTVKTSTISSTKGEGMGATYERFASYLRQRRTTNAFQQGRNRQHLAWLRGELDNELQRRWRTFLRHQGLYSDELPAELDEVHDPVSLADVILGRFLKE